MYKYYYLFDLISLLLIYIAFFLPRWKSSRRELFLKSTFYIYICFVLYFTLMPFVIPIPFVNFRMRSSNINLMPFYDFLQGHGGAAREFVLNIIMMVPYGILVPFIYRKKMLSTIKYTLGFSLLIETFQIFSYGGSRSFDTTDLISNLLGGITGFLLYSLFCPLASFLMNKIFRDSETVNKKPYKAAKRDRILFGIIILQLLVRSTLVAYL
ncbi:MAG: VanZ family protein [Lachnospiraceae bacterium]|nr:VanZ family protein [Lachnospiraceae bacterium]